VATDDFNAAGPGGHGPYRQSERSDIYVRHLEVLTDKGRCYPCFCTPDEVENERRDRARRGLPPCYSGKCADLDDGRIEELEKKGVKPAWRFRAGEGEVSWRDQARGEISWDAGQIGDFIIARPDLTPTYNFAAAVDDHMMEITHVIRGDDHLANTPKQLMIYRAMDWAPPRFAHLPLIVGHDKKPLAKRHGVGSLDDLYSGGFLPLAVVNYIATLGWSPPSGNEIIGLQEMAREFSLDRVKKSPAAFDVKKLEWMNKNRIAEMNASELYAATAPFLKNAGLDPDREPRQWVESVLASVQHRMTTLADAPRETEIYLKDPEYQKPDAAARALAADLADLIEKTETIDRQTAGRLIEKLGAQSNLSGPALFKPLRTALFGKADGPELAVTMSVLGRDRSLRRLGKFLAGPA